MTAHNLFLQAALDGGIFHALILVSLFCFAAARLYASRATTGPWPLALSICILFQGLWNYHGVLPLYFILFAAMCGSLAPRPQADVPEKTDFATPIAALLLPFLILHAFMLRNRADAIQALLPGSYKNASTAWVIKPADGMDLNRARTALQRANQWMESAELHQMLGEIEILSGRLEEAVPHFQFCASRADLRPPCLKRLAQHMNAAGRTEEGKALDARAFEHDPFGVLENGFERKYP